MPGDGYLPPRIKEHIAWTRATHGERSDAVFDQYREMAAKLPAVMKDLELFCSGRERSHVPGDSHATAFNEGRRDAYLRILALAELEPGTLSNLEKEAENERAAASRGRRSAGGDGHKTGFGSFDR